MSNNSLIILDNVTNTPREIVNFFKKTIGDVVAHHLSYSVLNEEQKIFVDIWNKSKILTNELREASENYIYKTMNLNISSNEDNCGCIYDTNILSSIINLYWSGANIKSQIYIYDEFEFFCMRHNLDFYSELLSIALIVNSTDSKLSNIKDPNQYISRYVNRDVAENMYDKCLKIVEFLIRDILDREKDILDSDTIEFFQNFKINNRHPYYLTSNKCSSNYSLYVKYVIFILNKMCSISEERYNIIYHIDSIYRAFHSYCDLFNIKYKNNS